MLLLKPFVIEAILMLQHYELRDSIPAYSPITYGGYTTAVCVTCNGGFSLLRQLREGGPPFHCNARNMDAT
jgi:hypothetical protein